MKTWLKLVIIGIILFSVTYLFLCVFILIELEPPLQDMSSVEFFDFYGSDSNNDTKIDTIEVLIINFGGKADEIIAVNFSKMAKNWILTLRDYPIELSPLSRNFISEEILIFSAVTNQDQITLDDHIYVEFFFATKGTTDPAIVVSNNDLIKEGENAFTLGEKVAKSYSYDHRKNERMLGRFLFWTTICSVISFSPLLIYLLSYVVRLILQK